MHPKGKKADCAEELESLERGYISKKTNDPEDGKISIARTAPISEITALTSTPVSCAILIEDYEV